MPPYAVAGGNPAKVIKYRFGEDVIDKLLSIDITELFDSFRKDDIEAIYTSLSESRLLNRITRSG
jgi:hypothetical protein